ncbi:MAG: hypothetical protein WCL51_09480 [Bacteroidota bacterium]
MTKKYQPKHPINYYLIINRERTLLKQHYDFIKFELQNGILYCYGEYKPTEFSINYKYRIKYDPVKAPQVTIRYPNIEYNDDIHMYQKSKSLCLYHKSDLNWNINCHLFDTIIPWTHEWFVYYELYCITGNWEHPFVPHKINEK